MKNLFSLLLLVVASATASAQGSPQLRTSDPFIQRQVDSLKAQYAKESFIPVKESAMAMESGYEQGIIVPLTAGTWYRIIFIGEMTSKLYEVRMFDWSEKQVAYQKKQWGEIDGNIIDYSYIPKITEYHMIKPLQMNKKKKGNLSGYIMLFKKVQAPAAK
jgi:hypothetical protein